MAGLNFHLSDDGSKLEAVFEPGVPITPIDEGWVNRALEMQGFADLYFFADASAELVRLHNSATERFVMEIGERRDGAFSLNTADDLMTAYLTITPPRGGRAVAGASIHQALREKKIMSGVLHEELEAAIAAGRAVRKLIARGRQPEPGKDGEMVSFIPELKERLPLLGEESAVIDYRNLGDIVSVKPGDPLMRRISPTAGEAGENVLGEPVLAISGNEVRFAPELRGTAFAPDDGDLLIAAIAGQPVLVGAGVIVEPTIQVQDVDLSTGNIHFEGSIFVLGNVNAGMEVKASGDIMVGGMVEAAQVEAGGNLEVKGGIIGHVPLRNGKGELNPAIARVQVKGGVSALFVDKALVVAGTYIKVTDQVMQSELNAGSRIRVGEPGMRRGHIIGGLCRAANLVHAVIIGSPAGVATRIEVGVDPVAQGKIISVKKQLEEKQSELEEAGKALVYIKENPARFSPETKNQKEQAYRSLQTAVVELTGQKKRLQKRLETITHATIEVERTIHDGVRLVIGDKSLSIDNEQENVTFRLGEEGIVC